MYYKIQTQNKACARHAIQHATTAPHPRNAGSSIIRPDHYDISCPYTFDDIHVDFAGNKDFLENL